MRSHSVVAQRLPVQELYASKDEALLLGWDALLAFNLLLDGRDRIGGLHIDREEPARLRLAREWPGGNR